MDSKSFRSWLIHYGHAWKTKNPNLIPELFTKEATYHEKSFDKPMVGLDEIKNYWKMISETQNDIQFEFEILDVISNRGMAHWSASFLRTLQGVRVELDGIFLVELNSENKCTKFQEWWHSKKTPIH